MSAFAPVLWADGLPSRASDQGTRKLDSGCVRSCGPGRSQIDGQALLDIYRQCGLHLEPAINAVEAGIYAVWQLMSSGKLKGFRSLGNWLSEFRLYQRDKDGNIVKQNDHLMDATRYLIMSGRERMRAKPQAPKQELVCSMGESPQRWMQ